MDKNAKHYPLNVTMPQHCAYVVRDLPQATVEQRERALNATHWNEFAFPSGMLTVDMLSDSGTTAMTNQQWATLFLGDEAYGRNTGYYVLLDTFRDIFERGGEKNWKKSIDLVRTDCRDVEKMMDELYLCEYEGGLFNGGAAQMERPNAFIIQQGRAAESVLMEIVKKILAQRHPGKVFTIPSNGHFDTTEGNIKQMGSIPRNLYNKELLYEIPEGGSYEKNPFKGNMDIEKLEQLIQAVGPENVPLVFTCITNNPICGQPVSMANIREINRVAHKYDIPLVFDVARWAENCYFIKMNEEGYADKSIAEIASEMFSYCDAFTMSAKKDGHANMGGMLAFRDRGLLWQKFSDFNEDGTVKTWACSSRSSRSPATAMTPTAACPAVTSWLWPAVSMRAATSATCMTACSSASIWRRASTRPASRASFSPPAATLCTSTWMSSSTASAIIPPSPAPASLWS